MIDKVDWDKINGLLPVIIQDATAGTVLMLGYMNPEALEKSLKEGIVTFFSRTKNRLWTKGESSGNFLRIQECALDCDNDALIIFVEPTGPTCHLNRDSCFEKSYAPFIHTLEQRIDRRFESGSESSYVQGLHKKGISHIAQKIGEEGVEVALASVEGNKKRIVEETADLFFHVLVNLRYHNIAFKDVINTLQKRVKP